MKLKKIIVVLLACMLGMAMGEQPFFQMKAKENGNISFAEQELQKTSQTNPINKEASKGYQLARPASKVKALKSVSASTDSKTYTLTANIHAVLQGDTLTISGTGEIPDYDKSTAPWGDYDYDIKKVIINKGITSIGQQAFRYLYALESVSLPAGLTSIKDSAFYRCRRLQKVSGGESLKSIGEGAFVLCSDLTSFTFPEGLTTIESFAFQDTALSTVTLPASLKTCKELAFMRSVSTFNVAAGNPVYSSKDGVLYNKDKTELVAYPANKTSASFTIPSSVTTIASYAFSDVEELQAIYIPSSVKTMKDWVFVRSGITSLTLPSSLKELGYGVAEDCQNLTTATIHASLDTLPYLSFSECKKLNSVVFDGKITTIFARAFYRCDSLSNIVFPNSLKQINVYAFYGCKKLTSLKFPSSLEYIEAGAFEAAGVDLAKVVPSTLSKMSDGSYIQIENLKIKGTSMYAEAKKVLDLVNKERRANGRADLIMDETLFEAAQQRAAELAVYYSHTRPSGLSCYSVSSLIDGENIAAAQSNANSVMNDWNHSLGHHSNIINGSFQSIGIGCFYHDGVHYWVQVFSRSKGTNKTTYASDALKTYQIQAKYNSQNYSISSTSKTIKPNASTTLSVYGQNNGWSLVRYEVEQSVIQWSSGDSSIANIRNGVVTGVKGGSTKVYALCPNGKKLTVNITVQPNTYKITYYLNGGTQQGNPSTYNNTSNTITLKNPTRKGYTFKGWYSDSKYKYRVTSIKKGSTGNKTLYAKWSKNTYKLSYQLNGGKNGKNPSSYTVTSNTITLKSPTRKGYTFKGWYSDSKYKYKVTSIKKGSTGNKTLYAKWSKNTYKLSYQLNGGKNGKNPSSYTVTSNTITLKSPTRKGYTFKGWYSDSKYKYKVTSIKKGSTGNKTLYAKWSKNTYKLSYQLNGGKNGKNPSSYTVTSNTITLKSPTRKGYTFKGWYSDSKYKYKVTSIKKGSTGNKKLYARWSKLSVGKGKTPTLKNSAKGKLSVKYGKVTYAKGYQITYSTSSKFTKSTTKSLYTSATSKTLSNMKIKKTYYVKVRAYQTDSLGSKVFGSYSTVRKVYIKY